jgi:hypothetical protein
MSSRAEHLVVIVLAFFLVLSAFAGAIGLIGGGIQFPLEWLEGTAFGSYVGPGIILGAAVGGSALAAAVLMLRGHPLAAPVALGAGLVQTGWIVGEVALIGTPDVIALWLQGLYFALGALLAALAADLWRRSPRSQWPRRSGES